MLFIKNEGPEHYKQFAPNVSEEEEGEAASEKTKKRTKDVEEKLRKKLFIMQKLSNMEKKMVQKPHSRHQRIYQQRLNATILVMSTLTHTLKGIELYNNFTT